MVRIYMTDGEGAAYTNDKRYADALRALGWHRVSRAEYARIIKGLKALPEFGGSDDSGYNTAILSDKRGDNND